MPEVPKLMQTHATKVSSIRVKGQIQLSSKSRLANAVPRASMSDQVCLPA